MIGTTTKPLLIFGTRHGTLYNLTSVNQPKVSAINLSFGDFYDNIQTLEQLPQHLSFKKFLNYPQQTLTYLSPYDFYKQQCFSGCQDSKIVKIKCSKGYIKINYQNYDKLIDVVNPDFAVALTEYPALSKNHKQDSNKSHKRAILKTKTYYEQSDMVKFQGKTQKKTKIMGPIHGGKNLSLLSRSLQNNLSYKIDGLVVCDLCDNQDIKQRQEIYNFINQRLKKRQEELKEQKMPINQLILCLSGQGKIQDIVHAQKFGYTMFQVNYPFTLAENHKALIYHEKQDYFQVRQPKKTESLVPLSEGCQCYACKVHNESYIAHLIECFQMNAKILLTIHNMKVYEKYFKGF